MNKKRKVSAWSRLGVIAATVVAMAGCSSWGAASRAPRPTVKPGEFGKPACFYQSQVRDYKVLDSRNLVIYALSANAYHVHIIRSLEDLSAMNPIAFSSFGDQVCGHAGDALLMKEDRGTGRYFITDIYGLDPACPCRVAEPVRNWKATNQAGFETGGCAADRAGAGRAREEISLCLSASAFPGNSGYDEHPAA